MGPRVVRLLCAVVVLMATTYSFSAVVVVGTCMPSKVSYDSLTDAVAGVPAGSTIQVCPGTYAEQIIVNKSLTIRGIAVGNNSQAVLVPPASGMVANAAGLNVVGSFFGGGTQFAAQVLVQGGAEVTLTGITIDDSTSNIAGCYPYVVGVLVQDASATLNYVSLKNQLQTCNPGGNGVGVLTQNDTGTGLPTYIKVQNSSFNSAGQAFESDGAGITATVSNSYFNATTASDANAITIVGSPGSTVQANSISNFNYPAAGTDINAAAFGVFIEQCAQGGTVAGNTISNTQVGIYLYNGCLPNGVSVTNNDVSNASLIAIDLGGTNGVLQGNDIRDSLTGIRIPGSSAGNLIQNNRINDVCAALGYNPAAGTNTVGTNTIFNAANLSIVNTTALCP